LRGRRCNPGRVARETAPSLIDVSFAFSSVPPDEAEDCPGFVARQLAAPSAAEGWMVRTVE